MIRHLCLALGVSLGVAFASLPAQEFLGKTADGWVKQLKTGDAKQRRNAAFALGKLGRRVGGLAVAEMRAAYANENDAKVRDAVVSALGEICRDVRLVYVAYLDE